ncbi:DMT family transporter [Aliiruegeria sabulilitoris]|uniref:DMT family transporter n=1 Tax=Aliiruegeria sabulilitoris TaxID=1510458 RepID=UPI00082AB9F4|nr:DMT family transporter [Aliiruegeria sabulilitoris]NDR56461.1 DMT family transporter [Pseudoruegeria sp. M32A2M]
MPRLPAATLFLSAVFLITAMSAIVRLLSAELPIGQILFWRSAGAVVPIVGYMMLRGEFPAAFGTRHPGLHVTRSLFGVLSMALSLVSLAYLTVATAQALAYLAPVLTLPMAALLAGERISGKIVLATQTGLAGVLLMLGEPLTLPGTDRMIGVAAGLGFALTMAFVRVHVRSMTRTERPTTIAFYFALTGSVAGLATAPFGWVTPDAATLGWLLAAGLLGGAAHVLSAEAVARAPVSRLAPLEYTGLLWALGFDLVLFGDVPTGYGAAGAAAILAAVALATSRPSRRG